MTADLLTTIQSEFSLHPNIAWIIGLLILITIFLAISKSLMGKRKKSADATTLKPNNEDQVQKDFIPEPKIEKKITSKIDLESKENPGTFKSYGFMTNNRSNGNYLFDEIKRIDTKVRNNLEKLKEKYGKGIDDLGLYVSENEVHEIINTPYEFTIKSKRLQDIKELFDLCNFEVDAFLICLIPELDTRHEKVYSYLQNDVTKKRPTVDLVINLLCNSMDEKLSARKYFSPTSSLIKNHLVYLTVDEPDRQTPLLSKNIKVDERIINYLIGENEFDPRIRKFSYLIEPKKSFNDIIEENNRISLIELTKRITSIKVPMFFFHGAYGTGKKMMAEAICNELETSLLVVDSKILLKGDPFETINIIFREALLQNSTLYLEGLDAILEKDAEVNAGGLIQELDDFKNWVFLSGDLPWMPAGILKNHIFIDHVFPLPSFELRKRLWKSFLEGMNQDIDIEALSSKFSFSAGQIRDAIFTARNIAMVKTGNSYLSMGNLYQGCKAQSNKNLSSFAKNIPPRYTWKDIILPKDLNDHLREVSGHIKNRGKVYTDWGFDAKLSLGKGLNVLFSGPSGAGKTMAAEIIANEASLDLYKVDLSAVVSKYIGETEKLLKKIFIEAETSNSVLFFDEADALFGKRSEVKDSHDRYANIEINYLLQKMEEHEGIVILASNFKSNIDEAFLRRMHFAIEFTFPDEDLREKIWRNIFPKETPISNDVDYRFLSRFKITGGNIKNIALNAAFLAAADSRHLFGWDEIPGNDSENLIDFVKKELGLDWVMDAKIEKIDNYRTIIISSDKNSLLLKLNDDKTKINLMTEDVNTEIWTAKMENGKLEVYYEIVKMEHIIRATKREFQKMGKLCTAADFGGYYNLVK
ncbi:MAG: ATP-binding protein [Candidatus Methanoperedens sp.]